MFGLFKKDPDKVLAEIVESIVLSSLHFRQDFADASNEVTAKIGAEVSYLALSTLDMTAYQILDEAKRAKYFDRVMYSVLSDYVYSVCPNMPTEFCTNMISKMQDALQSRMSIYGRCRSFMGEEGFPPAGSRVFAFQYFVYRALGKNSKKNVVPVLVGEKEVTDDNIDEFPGVEGSMTWMISIVEYTAQWKLKDRLESIK